MSLAIFTPFSKSSLSRTLLLFPLALTEDSIPLIILIEVLTLLSLSFISSITPSIRSSPSIDSTEIFLSIPTEDPLLSPVLQSYDCNSPEGTSP